MGISNQHFRLLCLAQWIPVFALTAQFRCSHKQKWWHLLSVQEISLYDFIKWVKVPFQARSKCIDHILPLVAQHPDVQPRSHVSLSSTHFKTLKFGMSIVSRSNKIHHPVWHYSPKNILHYGLEQYTNLRWSASATAMTGFFILLLSARAFKYQTSPYSLLKSYFFVHSTSTQSRNDSRRFLLISVFQHSLAE